MKKSFRSFIAILKRIFDGINNEKIKQNILNALPFWVGALACGAAAVLFANLFSWAEKGSLYLLNYLGYWFLLVTPLCFSIAYLLVSRFAPNAKGSGIPQVTASIELSNPKHHYLVDGLLSIRIILIKVLSCLTMALGGAVIGREGPTIQISASIFKKINDILPAWYPKISKRNMIVTGAAAGLAAAFNTPLGGIVFAIEELTKTHFNLFKSALLTGVIIAGLTALSFLGPYLYLGYPDLLANFPLKVIPLLMVIAITTGFIGTGMTQLIIFIFKRKKTLTRQYQHVIFAGITGLSVALMIVFIGKATGGSGKEMMITTLFTENKSVDWYEPVLRVVGSIFSFTSGGAGGVFAPSLSAGAGIGALLAEGFHLNSQSTNLLILCGMTGFLTSITRSPFTSSILVLEMTNSHNVIFYIMLTALLANLSATLISRHSFYDQLKDMYIREAHAAGPQVPADK